MVPPILATNGNNCGYGSHLWHISREQGGTAWAVASAEPVCPRCGTTLKPATMSSIRAIRLPVLEVA
jgi:hypothetical protein